MNKVPKKYFESSNLKDTVEDKTFPKGQLKLNESIDTLETNFPKKYFKFIKLMYTVDDKKLAKGYFESIEQKDTVDDKKIPKGYFESNELINTIDMNFPKKYFEWIKSKNLQKDIWNQLSCSIPWVLKSFQKSKTQDHAKSNADTTELNQLLGQ